MLRSGIAASYDSSTFSLISEEISMPISTVVVLVYPPIDMNESSSFPVFLPVLVIFFFEDSHSDWSEVKSQSSFNSYILGKEGLNWFFF